MNTNHLQMNLPDAPQSIAGLKDFSKVAAKLDICQEYKNLSGSVQTKNNILYLIVNLYRNGRRNPLWVSTKLRAKGNATKAKSMLTDLLAYIKNIASIKIDFYAENGEALEILEENSRKNLFADVLNKWLTFKKDYIADTTYLFYIRTLKVVEPYYRKKKIYIQDMTGQDIDDFCEEQRSLGKKVETVKRYLAAIGGAVHYAMGELKLIKHDITADMKQLIKPKSEIFTGDYYTEQELRLLLKEITHTKLELPVWLGGFYGLRRSEAIGLRCDGVKIELK